ncbi:M48 family metallopeptidase [Pectinatus sottacetonis]|uniref:M48 family metallopeptidase n=1 Tax=Pectinatus sottacetonis TaxID=1002795 RepID=UPI0018C7E436|nr:M48 family metallopeptidase [Pectinatus sottacetonis]
MSTLRYKGSAVLIKIIIVLLVNITFVFPHAYAFNLVNLGGALIGITAQYAELNKSIDYCDNKGRNEYFAKMKKQYGVDTDPVKNEILKNIVTRLSAAIAQNDPSINEKPYNYFVNKDKNFNAFCSLGHNLSVNSGLFDLLKNNEDEIAFVVGHEMGHGQENHIKKGIKKSLPINIIASVWGSQAGSTLEVMGIDVLVKQADASIVTKPQEWQADNLGFTYAVGAGYNPGAGAAVWQRFIEKMGQYRSNFVGEIFSPSDHPSEIDRRDNYANKLTKYSNGHMTVKNGIIKINGKLFMQAASRQIMSGRERAYLIAGAVAAVYHNNKNIPDAYVGSNGYIYMGDQDICIPIAGEESAQTLVDRINMIK